jgi:hypothetical protein
VGRGRGGEIARGAASFHLAPHLPLSVLLVAIHFSSFYGHQASAASSAMRVFLPYARRREHVRDTCQ